MNALGHAPQQPSIQPHPEFTLTGKIERTESGLHLPAFLLTVFGVVAILVALLNSVKFDDRVLIIASLVGLMMIVYQLRKLNLMGRLVFEPEVELALPRRYIATGEDVEVLFRQRLRRNYAVKNINFTIYAEVIDKSSGDKILFTCRS